MGDYGTLMPRVQEKFPQLGVTQQIIHLAFLRCSKHGEWNDHACIRKS